MKRALIVGGANGIGLSIATELSHRPDVEKVYIVDKAMVSDECMHSKFECHQRIIPYSTNLGILIP